MKKKITAIVILLFASILPALAFAQAASADELSAAVAAGQALSAKLVGEQASCASLADADYEKLGEYYMDRMMGTSHAAMNAALIARLGENGEEQMHIVMGKRMSGCDPQAAYPAGISGFMPMMGGNYAEGNWGYPMMGYGGMMGGFGGYGAYPVGMMGWGGYGGYSWLGWITTVLLWALLITGVLAAVQWLRKK